MAQIATQPASAPIEPSVAPELSAEAIKVRQQQVAEAADLDEETKAQVQDLYQKALEQLRLANEWTAKATEFETAMREAPARLEAIRAELAEPPPPPEPLPEIPSDASLPQLEQLLTQAEAKLTAAQAELAAAQEEAADLDREVRRRANRRLEVPRLVVAAQGRLDQVTQELAAALPSEEPTALRPAHRALLLAKGKATEEELSTHEKEIPSYDARGDLLTARRDQEARSVSIAEELVERWRATVAELQHLVKDEAYRELKRALEALADGPPTARPLAEENVELAKRRVEVAGEIESVSKKLEGIKAALTTLRGDVKDVQAKVEVAGLTRQAVSVLLRKQRAELPDIRHHRRRVRDRQPEISAAEVELFDLHDDRSRLGELEQQVKQRLEALAPSADEADVRELLQTKRTYTESLLRNYDSYFAKLIDLDAAERQLIAETKDYCNYIDENILWFRSADPLRPRDLSEAWQGLVWLAKPLRWAEVSQTLGRDAQTNRVPYAAALALFVIWLLLRRRLRNTLDKRADLVRSARTDTFGHTVAALAVTLAIASGCPALIGFLAWRLWSAVEASDFVKAIAVGLRTVAILFFTLELLRQACRKRGLGEVHFQWRQDGLKVVRRNLLWLTAVVLPAGFITSVVDWQQENDAWKDSLGRLALMAGLVCLGIFAERMLRPSGQLLKGFFARHRGGWLEWLRGFWYLLAAGIPIALALAAAWGYHYTVLQLSDRTVLTLWLLLGLVFANATMLRWLFVARRRLALEKAEKRLSAEAKEGQGGQKPSGERGEPVEEPEVNIFSMSVQTRQMMRSVVFLALLVGLWLIWADVLPALGILHRVQLWQVGPDEYVTLASLALAVLILVMTVMAAKNIPGLLEVTILQRLPLDHGVRYAITAVSRYLITIIGVVIGFGVIGIGWSKVQWLVAAMTVGLGFGLQEIFANFISGLIILFERPVRVGDTVTVGDITGTVTRIQIRSTTIRDWDRKELIVPNKAFITSQLINWTLSDTILRLVIPVGIAYGSDTQLVYETLLEVARRNPHVLDDPAPSVLFRGFGTSSLDFQLRVYVPSMEYYRQVLHEVHMAIDAAFREAGIEIAFPQQDIHVRSFQPIMPALQNRQETGPSAPPPSSDAGKGENA